MCMSLYERSSFVSRQMHKPLQSGIHTVILTEALLYSRPFYTIQTCRMRCRPSHCAAFLVLMR